MTTLLPETAPSSWATISDDGAYRYALGRTWGDSKLPTVFIGLNPSTADATLDDPTIRRCIDFAKRWGTGGIVMVNLFAYRATDPKDMKRASKPVGDDNDMAIQQAISNAQFVVAAWGAHGWYRSRDAAVRKLVRENGTVLHCLGRTKDGHPRHPLYVPAITPLEALK